MWAISEFISIVDPNGSEDSAIKMILSLDKSHILTNEGKVMGFNALIASLPEYFLGKIAKKYNYNIGNGKEYTTYQDKVDQFFRCINDKPCYHSAIAKAIERCGHIRNKIHPSEKNESEELTDNDCRIYFRYLLFSFITLFWYVEKCNKQNFKLSPIPLRIKISGANGRKIKLEDGKGKPKEIEIDEDSFEKKFDIYQFWEGEYVVSYENQNSETSKIVIKGSGLDASTWGVDLIIDYPLPHEVTYKSVEINLEYLGLECGNNKINDTVNKINQLLSEISAKCGDIGAVKDATIKIIEVLSNNVSSVNSLESKLDDIATKLSEIKGDKSDNLDSLLHTFIEDLQKTINANTENLQKSIDAKLKDNRKGTNKDSWRRYAIIVAILIIGIFGLFIADISIGLSPFNKDLKEWVYFNVSDNEHFAQVAFDAGSGNVAYDFAQKLESEMEIEQACQWYRKAITEYEALVEKAQDSDIAYTLGIMYLRGKGIFDLDKAKHYAKLAAPKYGKGLYIYILTRNYDWQQAKDDIALYKNKQWSDDNSFFELASILSEIYGYKGGDTKKLDSCFEKLTSLVENVSLDANLEADFELALLAEEGIEGLVAPNFARFMMGMDGLIHKNYLPAQILCASRLIDINCYDLAFSVAEMAWQNGEVDALPMLLICLENVEFDGKDDYFTDLYKSIDNSPELDNSVINKILSAKILEKEGLITEALDSLLAVYQEYKNVGVKDVDLEKMCMILNLKQEKPNLELFIGDSIQGTKRQGIIEYRNAVRYAKGYGVEIDSMKSDSLLRISATKGNHDAKFALAIKLRDAGELLDAINLLYSIDDEDNIAQEKLFGILNRIDPKLGLNYLSEKKNIVLSAMEDRELISVDDLLAQIELIEKAIPTVRNEGRMELMGCLLNKLAGLYSCVPRSINPHASNFALTCYDFAQNINRADFVSPYLLSDLLYEAGGHKEAEVYLKVFCDRYFNEDGTTKQESEKNKVLTVMQTRYPQLLDSLNKSMKCDLTNNLKPDSAPVNLRYEYDTSVDIFKY